MQLTHEQAADRINRYIKSGRLIRKPWHEGQLTELIPPWLSKLATWIDEAPSDEAWPKIVARYADLVGRSGVMTPARWKRLDYKCRKICVVEARSHVKPNRSQVIHAIDAVKSLIDRSIVGDVPSKHDWAAAAARATEAVAASDRMITAMFDAWEDEITGAAGTRRRHDTERTSEEDCN